MKSSFYVMLATLCAISASAYADTRAASSIELDTMPSSRTYQRVNYAKYPTRSTTANYTVRDSGNMYYTQPSSRSAMYREYDSNKSVAVRTTRAETLRTELKRKYFLAHPFFQPLQYKFGSLTDMSYGHNSYNIAFKGVGTPLYDAEGVLGTQPLDGKTGDWKSNAFAIKEDLSFGITDRLALMAMLRYDTTKSEFNWNVGTQDSERDSGLNMWGLGIQGRFVDTADWIGMASFYFEQDKDIANSYILELKGGYKINHSTIYAIGRGWLVDFDNSIYGNGTSGITPSGDNGAIFLAYKTDADSAFYGEIGFGDFSVLDEDWTFNLEALFGYYDWHNQISLKGAFGWQPNDWFALNLYGRVSLYDSANDKNVDTLWWQKSAYLKNTADDLVPLGNNWARMGKAELSDYAEYSFGLQMMFMF